MKEEKSIHDIIKAAHIHTPLTELSGHLVVYTTSTVNYAFWSRFMLSFLQEYPQIKLTILNAVPELVLEMVLRKKCDIGFITVDDRFNEDEKMDDNIELHKQFTEKIYAVAAEPFLLGDKTSVSLEDLNNRPISKKKIFTLSDEGQGNAMVSGITKYCAQNRLFRNFAAHIASAQSIGVALNSTLVQISLGQRITITPMNMPYRVKSCCIYLKNGDKSAHIHALLDLLAHSH